MTRQRGMSDWCVVCAFGAWVYCSLAWAAIEQTVVQIALFLGYFDKDAPTVLG